MTESHRAPGKESPAHPPRGAEAERRRRKVQQQLDEALADSFPASDPVSIVTSHQEEEDPPPS